LSDAIVNVDNETKVDTSTFPIAPADLINLAKKNMMENGMGTKDGGECLADNFIFRAQFVEVDKEGYLNALGSFKLEDAFDIQQHYFGWMVDPMQPNRVWFMNRQEAVQVNEFAGVPANGKKLILPPQNFHIDVDKEGKVTEFGFYTVDRAQGNTGGLGVCWE